MSSLTGGGAADFLDRIGDSVGDLVGGLSGAGAADFFDRVVGDGAVGSLVDNLTGGGLQDLLGKLAETGGLTDALGQLDPSQLAGNGVEARRTGFVRGR